MIKKYNCLYLSFFVREPNRRLILLKLKQWRVPLHLAHKLPRLRIEDLDQAVAAIITYNYSYLLIRLHLVSHTS